MRVMGIDPGIAATGYGIIDNQENGARCVSYGCIRTSIRLKKSARLLKIYNDIGSLIEEYAPDLVAIESLFVNKNIKTVLTVGEARGVIMVAAAVAGLAAYEYTPLQVKQAVSGYGRAEKTQVQKVISVMLKLKSVPRPDDAADALAVAFCHLHWSKLNQLTGGKKV